MAYARLFCRSFSLNTCITLLTNALVRGSIVVVAGAVPKEASLKVVTPAQHPLPPPPPRPPPTICWGIWVQTTVSYQPPNPHLPLRFANRITHHRGSAHLLGDAQCHEGTPAAHVPQIILNQLTQLPFSL